MPFINFASSGASQARNPQRTYDRFGFTSNGLQVTNSNGTNALSAYSSLGTTTQALCGIILTVFHVSSSVPRCQVTIRTGGSTVIVADLTFKQNTFAKEEFFIPLQIPTSTLVEVAVRTSLNGNGAYFAAKGVVANATDAPGFTAMAALITTTTASTNPSSTTVADGGTWVELVASTAATYGALYAIVGSPSSAPTNAQRSLVYLSTGTAGNEDASIFWEGQFTVSTSNPYVPHATFGPIEANIPSSTRLSMKIVGPASAPDTFPVGLWGLS